MVYNKFIHFKNLKKKFVILKKYQLMDANQLNKIYL